MVDAARIESHYLRSKESLTELLRSLPRAELGTPVPACPGWSVLDVVRHLVGTAEEVIAGKLADVPTEEQTAEQVSSRADMDLDELIEAWDEAGPAFASVAAELGIWPAAIDAVTHEHDIRHALGRPGDQTGGTVRDLARILGRSIDAADLRIETSTTTTGADDAPVMLRTTDFELLRVRMGRRSRAQLEALDWHGDPAPVVEMLCTFGPSLVDIEE